jgi:23S rRNA (cytosine1962-C5)-methyltransferase
MKPLYLHPGSAKRLFQGHHWVFSNEIASPLADYEPGSWVEVFSSRGVSLGIGYVNPRSLIAVRLVCPPGAEPTRDFFARLMVTAAHHRQRIYPGSRCHRVIFGEADGLPGLVVDRYEDVLVYQISTLGMACLEPLLRELLVEIFAPAALVFRHDAAVRSLEGLPLEKGIASGDLPEALWVELHGLQFHVNLLAGHKTGLYLDQRDNCQALAPWVPGKRVLDCFCYDGQWALRAAQCGAGEVLAVDTSFAALQRARVNAAHNQLAECCTFRQVDVFSLLRDVDKGYFDVIVLDPPAFAKSRRTLAEAVRHYIDLNRRALLALNPGGVLVTCSCSYHLAPEDFHSVLRRAAQAAGRRLRLLESRGQALDHPVLLAMPETRYLKCSFLQVL